MMVERMLLLIFAAFFVGVVTAQKAKSPWLTLNGDVPKVVARGGFSGLFPDSSGLAYEFAGTISLPGMISLCDVQLTKDGIGICLPTMLLNNSTNIPSAIPSGQNTYNVDGVNVTGWFSVDFNYSTLEQQLTVIRSELSRSDDFDGSGFLISRVEDVKRIIQSAPLWLNIEHDIFYRQHNLSMRNYLISVSRIVVVDYISSPEVGFLRSLGTRLGSKTKVIFRFLGQDIAEPSTKQTYGTLLKNLTFIKTFASGIVVPKNYIWPVTPDNYLLPHTSVVTDAHKAGLEIFAADFANDVVFSYNYSYDPISEYLNFVDNGDFAVDGVVTDFPVTPAEAIGCFSHLTKNSSYQGKPLVITHNGASGIYPDCTDLAYKQAVDDGADIIDCPVQLTKDGTIVCMSSINLMVTTDIQTSVSFSTKTTTIPELQSAPGIFTFNLSWDDIQKNLKPQIATPFSIYSVVRNPKNKNAGSFMKLSDFLTFAKANNVSGILITVEKAAYLAKNLGANITDDVIKALQEAGFSDQKAQDVMIQSTNSAVLNKFKQQTNYKLVYNVDETISDADPSSLSDIKKFATHITVQKESIFPKSKAFITTQTGLVSTLQKAGFTVFVYVLMNEFVSTPWDFFADPTVEINAYVQGVGVDGIVTDFPGTATRYRKNSCLKMKDDVPAYMALAKPGGLLTGVPPAAVPALAPYPVLDGADVVEPPLPSGIIKPVSGTPPAAQPSDSVFSASLSLILVVGAVYGSVFVLLFWKI